MVNENQQMLPHHAKRLVKLRGKMKEVGKNELYMGAWFNGQENEKKLANKLEKIGYQFCAPITERVIKECGTTACALGWGASMPEFRKRGLKMSISRGVCSPLGHPDIELYDGKTLIADEPFEVGQIFFGLSNDESFFLFDPSHYADDLIDEGIDVNKLEEHDIDWTTRLKPKHVINHINKVLVENGYENLV